MDEALRGYYTKYDCSAADVNPIGGHVAERGGMLVRGGRCFICSWGASQLRLVGLLAGASAPRKQHVGIDAVNSC